jgi:hypothetical protein
LDTARYARQSDRELNPNFKRRWNERFVPRTAPAEDSDAEPGLAILLQWRDEWRRRRGAERRAPAEAPPA